MLNSVMDCECCGCEQPISFHWMFTTTTFAIHHKIQLLVMVPTEMLTVRQSNSIMLVVR